MKTKKRAPNGRTRNQKKELNEMEASNLSNIEFKVMVIRMFNSVKKYVGTIKKGLVRNEEGTVRNKQ